ncbi:MAG: anthranilate synthase component I family protein [Nitrososphaeraceae archaeon]
MFHLHKLNTDISLPDLFTKIYFMYDKVFILESLTGPRELSEMTVIGFDPQISVSCDSNKFRVYRRDGKLLHEWKVTEPLAQLRKMVPHVDNNSFRFVGGAVGYVAYDAIRFWEDLPLRHKKKNKKRYFPLLEFGIYTDGILYDHIKNQAYYFYTGRKSRLKLIQKIATTKTHISKNPKSFFYSPPKSNMSKAQFIRAVNKLKRYIYDGDVYQVVLSRKMKFNVKGNLLSVYRHLREVNPSPYMYLLKIANRCIIGSSPEMLLRVTKDYVESFPIAGTRPIVNDEEMNEKLRRDLLNDEKEIAEHTMLVDLSRNDVGRVCKYGTVRVHDHMIVKRFSHVQHLVSHVTGHLQDDKDSYDAFKAVFPAGTVSGAPKVRAMEIIDEVEREQREAYAGAVGYFSFNGSCDFAITIRSLFVNKNKAYIQSGAGIVMDSVPEKEWMETEQKADAILSTLKKSMAKC